MAIIGPTPMTLTERDMTHGDIVRICRCQHFPPHDGVIVRLLERYDELYPAWYYGENPGEWRVQNVETGAIWSWESERDMERLGETYQDLRG